MSGSGALGVIWSVDIALGIRKGTVDVPHLCILALVLSIMLVSVQ
jgi:hypothetical protein